MKRRAVGVVTLTLVLVAAISGLTWLNAAMPRAAASASAPQADANQAAGQSVVTDWGTGAQARGTAEWTVSRTDLISDYPNGFTFELDASSTGGAIVSARVEWTHRAHEREGVPLTVRRADGEIDPASGTITATWTPTGATAVPPWVAVNYRWLLRDAAGNEYTTDSVQAEYSPPASAGWSRQESDDVLVFWTGLPANMGDLVVEAMNAQRQKYVDGWGQALPYRPRVILFGDVQTWLEWQVGHQDTTGLGVINVGLTSDDWGGTVQVLYGGTARDLAYGTVLHETEHLYQGEFLVKRISFTPGWFIEGDASFYQEDDIDSVATTHVSQLVLSNDLPALLQGDGPTIVGANSLDGYYLGYMFFKYLDLQWGIAMHRQIMDLLAANTNFTDAIEQATGLSVQQLESNWRAWLGASGAAPTLAPTWTPPAFLPTPTLMQFGTQK